MNTMVDLKRILAVHLDAMHAARAIDAEGFTRLAKALAEAEVPDPGVGPRAMLPTLVQAIDNALPPMYRDVVTLGLTTTEITATMMRMAWRQGALTSLRELIAVRRACLEVAELHVATLMPVRVQGVVAVPTTFAHLLGGLIAPLASAQTRIVAAFTEINRSPMGAGVLAGEIFAGERRRQADLLGFDALIPHTLVAIADVEDFVALMTAWQSVVVPLRRFLEEISVLTIAYPDAITIAGDEAREPEPSHPMLRLPTRLADVIAQLGEAEDLYASFGARMRSVPYVPIGSAAHAADAGYLDLGLATAQAVIADLTINPAILAHAAGEGFATSADLALFLIEEEHLRPTDARAIARIVLGRLGGEGNTVNGITQAMLDAAAMLTIGRELKVEMERLGRYLAPRRFLERRATPGSPAAEMMREWIAAEYARLEADEAWLDAHAAAIASRITALDARFSLAD